jgi:Type I phosphodiesterase / nucleotide pyrophosphatase
MTTQVTEPVLPRYGEACLDAVATSVLAALGVPDEPNPLRLAPAERVCLLVVDGLGWDLLNAHPAAAPFLSELARAGAAITAGFPATTATSLTSLGTGRPPGQHGMLGYQVLIPGQDALLNALRWNIKVDPLGWQPGSTIFERAAASGVACYRVAPGAYEDSGLSVAAMRGAQYLGAETAGALVSRAAAGMADAAVTGPVLVSVYYGDLDATGHSLGCGTDAWQYQLAYVDKLAEQLAGALPHGTALHIVADHGMTDVQEADRVDVDARPELLAGVALLGGEPRARHLYCEPGAAGDVLGTWSQALGDRFWVAAREQAIADGWFGQVDERFAARIGDVVVAPSGTGAVVATRTEPRESRLVGMHGSLTPGDQLVPFLTLALS